MVTKHTADSKKKISSGLLSAYETGRRTKKSPMQGRKHSPETLQKMRQSANERLERLPHTKPNHTGHIKVDAKYEAIHSWANKYFGKKELCEHCGATANLDWANKDGEYTRNRDDWFVLCRSCHMKYDRANNVWKPERLKR